MPSTLMRDSNIDNNWLRDMVRRNPPQELPDGQILSGPVRLSFVHLFTPGKPGDNGQEGKYGAALLFPPGVDMRVFEVAWNRVARGAFPNNWTPDGKPIGLHSPFHDQGEKAYSAKPLSGYTPGAIFVNVLSKFRPIVVHASDPKTQVTDEARAYAGVWAVASLNTYSYKNKKTGVGFGLQQVMLIADNSKLAGGGGDPVKTFAGVQITAQSNIAAKFDQVPSQQQGAPAGSIMPSGGHVGVAGTMAVQPLPGADPWD